MAVGVIDPLEVIDIDHRQPIVASAGMVSAVAFYLFKIRVLFGGGLQKGAVKSLSVQQLGQRISLTVVQQMLEIAVQPQHARQQAGRCI